MKRKPHPIPPLPAPTIEPDKAFPQLPTNTLLVGIDWADGEHAYAMLDPHGNLHRGTVRQSSEDLSELLRAWRKQFPQASIDVCLETPRGPLVNALLEHPQVQLYPINPTALANYREAFAHGGGKNDPLDAHLILQFLKLYRQQLRPLRRNQPITRELAILCEDRRHLVEQRVALAQQLQSLLKAYFPAILVLQPAKIFADFIIHLLLKFPTLATVQAAGRTKLRRLFFARGTRNKIEQRIDLLMNAKPLSTDEVLLRTSARCAQAICAQLASLNQSIRAYDQQIKSLLPTHSDYAIVQTLPCGAISKARLLAALGDDRSRYRSAQDLAAATGIAPLTTQSGKQRYVSSRWACSKFLKQTFHEFAGLSITKSPWAKAYYQQQLARGKTPQVAKRALAYKWIRIIYRCWQNRTPYQESSYLTQLQATGSPLLTHLEFAS